METFLERELDEKLRRQMLVYGQRYDIQTGLLNHGAFQHALAEKLRTIDGEREVALVWIEVLSVRREFELLGSKGVEALLLQAAEALRGAVDPGALLGRFGVSCFLVALEASKFDKVERRRIQAIADALSPIRALDSCSMLEIGAGVSFWPTDTSSPDDLIRFASLAANRAAYLRSQEVLAFRSGMNQHVMRDHLMEVEMYRGLDHGHFRLVYQPQIDLHTGRVLGAEALIRWDHPEWGAVSPSKFIPVAERSVLIQNILEFTLRNGLRDAQQWASQGIRLPLLSANMSWANMRRNDFVRTVREIVAELPVPGMQLEMEITESVLFDDEELFINRVRQLKAIGARIALDDFGTRYTGFNLLKRIPLDTMKIDRCFVQGIDRSQDMRVLCQTIVTMGQQLNLQMVAEGVEEPGELHTLREIGCNAAQGYLLQEPAPADEFAEFLQQWPRQMRALGFRPKGNLTAIEAAG